MIAFLGNKYAKKLLNEVDKTLTDFGCSSNCKSEIMSVAKEIIQHKKNDAKNIVDYTEMAIILITNISFDLLSSGKYHIYTNHLNYIGESLYATYQSSMKWGVKNNKITQEQFEEQLDMLRKNIRFVG